MTAAEVRDQPGVGTAAALGIVARGVYIELKRRKDFYVLLMLMLLYVMVIAAVRVVGIDNAATGTLLLNLGMTLAAGASVILTLLLAARQLPDEIDNRTLFPLLARPVSRPVVLAGKWLACWLGGVFTLGVLLLLGWGPAPKLESYDAAMAVQALLLLVAALSMVSASALLLSVFFPKGVTIVAVGLWIAAGGKVTDFATRATGDGVFGGIVDWLFAYLPQFHKYNTITRYTDGAGPLPFLDFASLVAYAIVFTSLALLVAGGAFSRRPL